MNKNSSFPKNPKQSSHPKPNPYSKADNPNLPPKNVRTESKKDKSSGHTDDYSKLTMMDKEVGNDAGTDHRKPIKND